jgi:hypothetical protein
MGGRAGARPVLELGLAVLAAASFLLPLISVSASASTSSLYSNGSGDGSLSVSVLDYLQHTNWTQWIELDLIVFGGLGVLAVATMRALDPSRFSPRVTLLGFATMAAGLAWLLFEWNDSVSSMTSLYLGSVNVTQGPGLWLGFAAALAGAFVCLVPTEGQSQ